MNEWTYLFALMWDSCVVVVHATNTENRMCTPLLDHYKDQLGG